MCILEEVKAWRRARVLVSGEAGPKLLPFHPCHAAQLGFRVILGPEFQSREQPSVWQ